MTPGSAAAKSLLLTMEAIGTIWGIHSALGLGTEVAAHGVATDASHWASLWTMHGEWPSWSEGGIATGPLSGYPATLHGTELIIPMNDGLNVPVKMLNGGSTQAGANQPTDINITLEIDGQPLDVKIKRVSGNIAETHRVNLVRWGKQNSPARQPV